VSSVANSFGKTSDRFIEKFGPTYDLLKKTIIAVLFFKDSRCKLLGKIEVNQCIAMFIAENLV
jgi:hypothetical protein